MQSRDFCYWLQGFFEVSELEHGKQLTPAQVDIVRRHLNMVFKHEIDPSFGGPEKQSALDKIHQHNANAKPGDPMVRC